jgi:hypothetical protein
MKLHSRIHGLTLPEPKILRIADSPERPDEVKALEALVVHRPSETINDGFGLVLSRSGEGRFPQLPPEINYVQTGDIIRVSTNGEISVIYRKTSRFNAMLVTERCNSKCLMCSQPPKAINDDFLIEDWLKAIPGHSGTGHYWRGTNAPVS